MNVPTITMDKEQAKAKLKAYRAELHHKADAEYQAAAEGYAALAEGLKLIDIGEAIHCGGYFESGLPRLAVARADRPAVHCQRRFSSFDFDASRRTNGTPGPSLLVSVPNQTGNTRHVSGWTRVPMVPADVNQSLRAMGRSVARTRYHILWEVEKWYERNPLEPPRDPFLLKHIGGSLYAVLAEWDLTDLEMSVMRRLTPR